MGDAASLTILYLDINTEWRGGQRQLLWMGEGLRRHGGRPIFALRTGAPLAERARASGIEVIAIDPLIAEWGPWTVLRLRRVIKREKVSIVHAQSGHTMALAALQRREPGGDRWACHVLWAGDSRAYVFQPDAGACPATTP